MHGDKIKKGGLSLGVAEGFQRENGIDVHLSELQNVFH
jgi:hypothetical protein